MNLFTYGTEVLLLSRKVEDLINGPFYNIAVVIKPRITVTALTIVVLKLQTCYINPSHKLCLELCRCVQERRNCCDLNFIKEGLSHLPDFIAQEASAEGRIDKI